MSKKRNVSDGYSLISHAALLQYGVNGKILHNIILDYQQP